MASSSGGGSASVQLADGSKVTGSRGVVVATDGPAASQLLGSQLAASPSKSEAGVGTCCLYFRSAASPLLVINANPSICSKASHASFPGLIVADGCNSEPCVTPVCTRQEAVTRERSLTHLTPSSPKGPAVSQGRKHPVPERRQHRHCQQPVLPRDCGSDIRSSGTGNIPQLPVSWAAVFLTVVICMLVLSGGGCC